MTLFPRIFGRGRSAPRSAQSDAAAAAPFDAAAAIGRLRRQPPPAVVVPIYNAPQEVDDCIQSLLRHAGGARLILIEDASPDASVRALLAGYESAPGVEIHRNDSNLGFTRSANRGIALAGRADVVLLNSDTKVTPRWLQNLRLAAYSEERVGTATPLSNNAGAFSAPEPGVDNPLPDWLDLDKYARLVTQASARAYPRVPTGSGFCMYIRRDCLDRVGLFDADAFPRGYGEENDFCRRAARTGWAHVVDDATLIYHVRSASFGNEKAELLSHARRVIDMRYPEYGALVRGLDKDPALRRMRERLRAALSASRRAATPVMPRRLVMTERDPAPVPMLAGDLLLRVDGGRLRLLRESGASGLDRAGSTDAAAAADALAAIAAWIVRCAVEEALVLGAPAHADLLREVCAALAIPVSEAAAEARPAASMPLPRAQS